MARLSRASRVGTRPRSWWTNRMPAWSPAFVVPSESWSPSTNTSTPGSGSWYPARILIRVDLPQPFWPTSARTSPGWIARSTSMSARCPVNVLDSPRISTAGVFDIRLLGDVAGRARVVRLDLDDTDTRTSRNCNLRHSRWEGVGFPDRRRPRRPDNRARPDLELVPDYRNPLHYDPCHC